MYALNVILCYLISLSLNHESLVIKTKTLIYLDSLFFPICFSTRRVMNMHRLANRSVGGKLYFQYETNNQNCDDKHGLFSSGEGDRDILDDGVFLLRYFLRHSKI